MDCTPVEVSRLARQGESGVPAEPPPWDDWWSEPDDVLWSDEDLTRQLVWELIHRRGVRITKVDPGDKRAKGLRWSLGGQTEADVPAGWNVGAVCGAASAQWVSPDAAPRARGAVRPAVPGVERPHDLPPEAVLAFLVAVDLDGPRAVALADGHLPPTDMVCGREGKPRSHRYYLVHGVPPEHEAGNETARHFPAGRRGPRTARWQAAGGGGEVLALLGTGSQATVPPSTWVGPGGSREHRIWFAPDGQPMSTPGMPAVLPYERLYEACRALAVAAGARERGAGRHRISATGVTAPLPAAPDDQLTRRALRYLKKLPPGVKSAGRYWRLYRVARLLTYDLAMPEGDAWPLLLEYNARCRPPRTEDRLTDVLRQALEADDHPDRPPLAPRQMVRGRGAAGGGRRPARSRRRRR